MSPKIYRKAERAAPTVMVTTAITATAGRAKIEVIKMGVALFLDTGVFQDGVAEDARGGKGGSQEHYGQMEKEYKWDRPGDCAGIAAGAI